MGIVALSQYALRVGARGSAPAPPQAPTTRRVPSCSATLSTSSRERHLLSVLRRVRLLWNLALPRIRSGDVDSRIPC